MSEPNHSASEDRAQQVRTHVDLTEKPPSSLAGILRRLGPGLIVAGSIVGSGELIATTKTGADAGFALLWLIVIGCLIKVFVQVELGRYTIVSGKATIGALNEVPGPSLGSRGNWLVWFWFLMFVASIAQLGGIVGGVGQAMAISAPITSYGRDYNEYIEAKTAQAVDLARRNLMRDPAQREQLNAQIDASAATVGRLKAAWIENHGEDSWIVDGSDPEKQYPREPYDAKLWAALVTVITMGVLIYGRYGLIQGFSTALVATFTLVTVVNLCWLQTKHQEGWAVSFNEFLYGMSFRLPSAGGAVSTNAAIATALQAFGIIGVGASELISYPYWCLEKGYARYTGPREQTDAWAARARGWLRVMQWDAWCSMVVYTFATIAFYLLGAAILGRIGLSPASSEMIRTLSVMYQPVFGAAAQVVFLFGAVAVLYSTFFVANASHARVVADALGVLRFTAADDATRRRWVRFLSGFFPLVCLTIYVSFPEPVVLVLIGGMMQAFMLPMLAAAALYFRYYRSDSRLLPSKWWDICLWVSSLGMLIAGIWLAYALLESKGPELLSAARALFGSSGN